MTFKNINTQIEQELGRIAGVQHRAEKKYQKPRVMTCDAWRDYRFEQMREKGIKIEHGHCGPHEAWKITNPKTGNVMIVPQAEIEADYKRCYLKITPKSSSFSQEISA